MQSTPQAEKIQCLEGLRGVMAWWVVLGHLCITFDWSLPLVDRPDLAVNVFIILSGFVIAGLIERKAEPYAPYILRRGFRLFPLYLVALLISVLLLQVQLSAWEGLPFQYEKNVSRAELAQEGINNLGPHLAAHLLLAQGLVPDWILARSSYTLIGQAWSISLEWQFYLLAPLFMWCARARLGWIAAIAAFALLTFAARYMPDAFLGASISYFGIGIASYLAFVRPQGRWKWLGVCAVFTALVMVRSGLPQIVPLGIWFAVIGSAAAPAPARHPTRALARLLSSTIPVHLGQLSYSTYLIHMIPLYCSASMLVGLGATAQTIQIGVLASTMVGAYILSLVTYNLIEKPGITLGARLTGSRKPVIGSPAAQH